MTSSTYGKLKSEHPKYISRHKVTADPLNVRKRCKCKAKGRKLHPCPYQEDVRNNSEPYCNCCKACEKECLKDI